MANAEFIRYNRNDVTTTVPSGLSCAFAPVLALVYDTDGARGNFGNIMTVAPSSTLSYQFVILKYNLNVDFATGGLLVLNSFQLDEGDSVWLNGQSNPTQNGIYTVHSTAWTFVKAVDSTVFVDLGARSVDAADGDITRSIIVDHSSINFNVTGFYSIIYYSMNSQGILATRTRKVKVVNLTASISPVPGYKITQYDIADEADPDLAAITYGDTSPGAVVTPSANSTDYIRKDGSITFIANQSMGGFNLKNVADPIYATDAVNLETLSAAVDPLNTLISGQQPVSGTVAISSISILDTLDPAVFRTVKWVVEINNPTLNTFYATELMFVNTSTGGDFSIYGSVGNMDISEFGLNVVVSTSITLQISNLSTYSLNTTVVRFKVS